MPTPARTSLLKPAAGQQVEHPHNGQGSYHRQRCEYPEEHSEHALPSLACCRVQQRIVTHGRRSCNNVVAILAKDKTSTLCSRCETPVLRGASLSVTMPGGGTRPGEEVRDGPHNNNRCGGNRCGVAPTAAPLRPQAEAELPRFGAQALRFATTTGGRQTSLPPVAPSVAASKHTSARIETCFKGTTTDINNA